MKRYLHWLCTSLTLWLVMCPVAFAAPPPSPDDSWEFPPELLTFDEQQYVLDLSQIHESIPVSTENSPDALWTILGQNEARGHLHLGIFYFEENKYSQAEEEFLKSIILDPENPLAHFNLGLALNQRKDWEGARNAYLEALRLNPDLNIAHTNLGTLNLNRKHYHEALDNFTAALELDPSDLKARTSLGHLHFYVFKNFPAAKKEYQAALKQDPKIKRVKSNLKTILHEERQAREAQKKFEKSLEETTAEDLDVAEFEVEEEEETEEVKKSETTTGPKNLFKF